ncbi:Putative ZDHHC-type palmitoyltransferase 6 [Fusarium oxysporum f. sp. cubense race 1]|uniref:Putative ZDHHC-type palmitoyltransferase 6 n=1 Tax=Fusarium oxysporum f. sp. cubense (strain race 1) TaxID=1229664 RepID=N4TMW9_FUSC1|nr:Putative ZDHHC-type palmitoyltransferase 6 [Fusarium oxysporum f. sp. cubense race 1]
MVDPISIIGLVGQISDLIQRAYNYGKAVHDAQSDMRKLYTELLGLKGVLEQLEKLDIASAEPHIADLIRSKEFRKTLSSTSELVGRLVENLNKKQTSSRRVNAFLWPWVKDDVKADIQDLERAKTWFIVMMMAENSTQMEVLLIESHEILNIAREGQEKGKLKHEVPNSYTLKQSKRGWNLLGHGSWTATSKLGGTVVQAPQESSGFAANLVPEKQHCIEQLKSYQQEDPKIGQAYFYCSFDDRESQQPLNILGSILHQLSEQHPEALEGIDQLRKSGEVLGENSILKLTSQYVSNFDKFYISVDAINESFSCIEVFEMLLQLVTENSNVRLFVTAISSSSHWLEDLQLEEPPEMIEVDMGTEDVDRDIDFYITTRISGERLLRRLSNETKLELREKVLGNTKGMFRYAQCQLDSLSTLRTAKMVFNALYDLPKDIYEVYEKILLSIPEADRLLARESLFSLSVALRPLTIQELAEAAVLDDYEARIDEECRLPEPMVLLEICQGLVDYDAATSVVTLAHSSVRAYITSSRTGEGDVAWFSYNIPGIHAYMANKCLLYLLLESFQDGCCTNEELEKKYQEYPLLRYASRYWPLHARLSDNYGRQEDSAMTFCLSSKKAGGGNFSFWVQCLMPDASREAIMASEPLYYASSFGLAGLVKSLLTSQGVDVDARGGRFRSSALHVASYRGHVEIARQLLDCGADINLLDSDGRTALFWATRLGRKEIVDLLEDPKYAQTKSRSLVTLSEDMDYPLWFCCACNGGPQRGRFNNCLGCRSHERCEKCIKLAGLMDVENVPESQSRWVCCNCEAGPTKVETKECRDCEHEKCRRCWVFNAFI